jgi:hypothetical protein
MLPPVTLVNSVHVVLGGALVADFACANGNRYWLRFGVHLSEAVAGFREAVGYLAPILIDPLDGSEMNLSWQHARVLLNQLKPLLREDRQAGTLAVMLDVASHEGAVTAMAREHFPNLYGPRRLVRCLIRDPYSL